MCKLLIKKEVNKITKEIIKKRNFEVSLDYLIGNSININLVKYKNIIIYEIVKELSNNKFSIISIDPFIIKEI